MKKRALDTNLFDILAFLLQILVSLSIVILLNAFNQLSSAAGFMIVSVLVGFGFQKKRRNLCNALNSLGDRIIFSSLCIYTAFVLVGNRILVYPINGSVSHRDLIILLLALVWSFQAVCTLFYFFDIFKDSVFYQDEEKEQFNRIAFTAVILAIIFIPAMLSLAAFNPGISDSDSTYSIYFAYHLKKCINWFPPFYYLYLRALLSTFKTVYAIVVFQWIFFSFVILEFAFLLYDLNVKKRFIYLAVLFISINPANYLHLNAIWKDAPYLCSILWMTVILLRISICDAIGKNLSKKVYPELTFSIVLTWFFRKNGIIPVMLTVLTLIILFFFNKNKKILISAISGVLIIALIHTVVYPAMEIRDYKEDSSKQGDAFIGLGQDILGVYYSGGRVSEKAEYIVKGLSRGGENYKYDPTYYSDWKSDLDIGFVEFIRTYIDVFLNNPVKLINAFLCRNDGIWSIFHGEFGDVYVIGYDGNADGETVGGGHYIIDENGKRIMDKWNDYAPAHKDNVLTGVFSFIDHTTANVELIKVLIWRSGLSVWLMIMVWGFAIIKKKNLLLPFVPVVGHIVSLMLACGWAVFRYYWPINLMAQILVVTVYAFSYKKDR